MNFSYVLTPSHTTDCHAKLTTSVALPNKKKLRENVKFFMKIGSLQFDHPISWSGNKVAPKVKNAPNLKLLV